LAHALDVVLVSLGAGAMATGVGYALKYRRSEVKVICVQPHNAPAMTLSFRAGRVIEVGAPSTIADGVAGRYGPENQSRPYSAVAMSHPKTSKLGLWKPGSDRRRTFAPGAGCNQLAIVIAALTGLAPISEYMPR
jgi:hypothetical protein